MDAFRVKRKLNELRHPGNEINLPFQACAPSLLIKVLSKSLVSTAIQNRLVKGSNYNKAIAVVFSVSD